VASLALDTARALFERRRAAWLAEDVDAYLALFADDIEISVPGRDEPVRGMEAYSRLLRRSFEWARPRSFDFHHLAVSADGAVLAEWTITTERRDRGAIVAWRGMSVCGIAAGRIRWWREYWDPGTIGGLTVGRRPAPE
jgi:ketosteroid isomerase-like protein